MVYGIEFAPVGEGNCSYIRGQDKKLYINSLLRVAEQFFAERQPSISIYHGEAWIAYQGIGSIIKNVLFKYDTARRKPKSVKLYFDKVYYNRNVSKRKFLKGWASGFDTKKIAMRSHLFPIQGDNFVREKGLVPMYIYTDRSTAKSSRRTRVCFDLLDGRHLVIMFKGNTLIYVKLGFHGTIASAAMTWSMDLVRIKKIHVDVGWQNIKFITDSTKG